MSTMFKKAASVALMATAIASMGAANAAETDARTFASTTLYGGGATLPAIAYVGSSFFTSGSRLTNPADAGSLFGAWSSGTGKPTVSYCQTGSGFGRGVLIGTNNATGSCGSFNPPVSPTGFSAPTADANLAFSDAPLSDSDNTTFHTNKGATKVDAVQVPLVAGSIAIPYTNADAAANINLTDANLCNIFSGAYTNWSQIPGLGLPSKAIKIVYRTDGSGTSFAFTNHLSKVCGTVNGGHFVTTSTYSGAFTGGLPAGAIGASGNPGVVSTIDTTEGAIGYGEFADAKARGVNGIANVNGKSPDEGLKATFSLPSGSLVPDQVITGVDANGRPTLGSPTVAPTHAGCLLLAKPDSYATSTTNYPIVAVSYAMGYYAGNGADKANIQSLLKAPYTFGVKSKTTTIGNKSGAGNGTGFAYIGGSGVSTAVKNAITSCIQN